MVWDEAQMDIQGVPRGRGQRCHVQGEAGVSAGVSAQGLDRSPCEREQVKQSLQESQGSSAGGQGAKACGGEHRVGAPHEGGQEGYPCVPLNS